jgi:hypothetical protein
LNFFRGEIAIVRYPDEDIRYPFTINSKKCPCY